MKPIALPPQQTLPRRLRHHVRTAAAALTLALLAACGGGGGDGAVQTPLSCSTIDQKVWLRSYFDDWYFWYALAPKPSPGNYTSVGSYFDALLYTGGNVNFPADRWSFTESTESFN